MTSVFRRLPLLLVLFACAGSVFAGGTAAQFQPLPESLAMAPASESLSPLAPPSLSGGRRGLLHVDVGLLEGLFPTPGSEPVVTFGLFPDLQVDARVSDRWVADSGTAWAGTIQDSAGGGDFTISLINGRPRATFNTAHGWFHVVPTTAGPMVLEVGGSDLQHQIASGPRRNDAIPVDASLVRGRAGSGSSTGGGGGSRSRLVPVRDTSPATVTILLAHTGKAETLWRVRGLDPATELLHLVNRANAAFLAGDTHTQLKVVAMMGTPYAESPGTLGQPGGGFDGIETDLNELSCELGRAEVRLGLFPGVCAQVGLGSMTDVRARRVKARADLAHLIVGRSWPEMAAESDGTIGIARLPWEYPGSHFAGVFGPWAGYGVTELLGTFRSNVFTHEIGHNFGLHHDRHELGDLVGLAIEPYSYGYVNSFALLKSSLLPTRWRTIMSYDSACRGVGLAYYPSVFGRCLELNRFSTPWQMHNGHPTGVPGVLEDYTVDGPADAARGIRRTARLVEQYY